MSEAMTLKQQLEHWEALAAKAPVAIKLGDAGKFYEASRETIPALCAALREAVDIIKQHATVCSDSCACLNCDGGDSARAFLAKWEGK